MKRKNYIKELKSKAALAAIKGVDAIFKGANIITGGASQIGGYGITHRMLAPDKHLDVLVVSPPKQTDLAHYNSFMG